MTSSQYTQGPFSSFEHEGDIYICAERRDTANPNLAVIHEHYPDAQQNAKLFSAAPDMAEALNAVLTQESPSWAQGGNEPWWAPKVRAALTKAGIKS